MAKYLNTFWAASFNHGSGALIRALNVMGTPAGSNAFKVYGEIDRGREASEMMKKSGVKRKGSFAEKKEKEIHGTEEN